MRSDPAIESIDAVTLGTHDMARAVTFYQSLGFELRYGGPGSEFTSFRAGDGYLNLISQPLERLWSWWGRLIFHVSDVDDMYERVMGLGLQPELRPVTPSGASATSISSTPTATNSASPGSSTAAERSARVSRRNLFGCE